MNQATLDFIREHAADDVRQLAFQGGRHPEVDMKYALDQIAGRQTARRKLPRWAALDGIVYPPHLSMEQCSSELTARYKAQLVRGGQRIVDLTGGFGVDFSWLACGFHEAAYVERNPDLCAISSHNFPLLGLAHAQVVCAEAETYLHQLDSTDLIYLDPARRDAHGSRTFAIADCTPNVLEILDEMAEKSSRILLKLSPMLDWHQTVRQIEQASARVSEVHIVSVSNECKELLILVEGVGCKVEGDMLRVACVNLLSDGSEERFEYSPSTLHSSPSTNISLSSKFLFEPNASVMKAGCFALLQERFSVSQLGGNSHLFVADADVPEFPGRRFRIERICSMNKRELRSALDGISQANISVRNFPLTVDGLRRRLKLKDGGDVYIFATTVEKQGHQLFVCRKIG